MAQRWQNPFGLQYPPAPGVNNTAREVLEPLNLSLYTMSTMQTSKKIKKIKNCFQSFVKINFSECMINGMIKWIFISKLFSDITQQHIA